MAFELPFIVLLVAVAIGLAVIAWLWRGNFTRGQKLSDALQALAVAEERDQQAQHQLYSVEQNLQQANAEAKRWQTAFQEQREIVVALEAKTTANTAAEREKQQLMQHSAEQMQVQFEQLAKRIFNDQQQSFQRQSQAGVEQSVQPLKQQLSAFKAHVDSVHERDSRDRLTLLQELAQLKALNRQMADEALSLAKALKGDSKVQGNWGEVILQRILESSGLVEGRDFSSQLVLSSEQGQRRLPDAVIHLPQGRDLVVDAKVSLNAYEDYCAAEDEAQRGDALKRHIQSLRQHIRGLSDKQYDQLPGLNSVDFVFIFVPIEAAFMLAIDHEPQLLSEANEKHIALASPSTLMATLRTIEHVWRQQMQQQNASEIARLAGGLYDQFVLFYESLEDTGRQLDKATASHQQSIKRLATGRGNLVKRIEELQTLGAKAKRQLPEAVVATANEAVTETGDNLLEAQGSVPKEC